MSMQNVMATLAVGNVDAESAWYTKRVDRGSTHMSMAGEPST